MANTLDQTNALLNTGHYYDPYVQDQPVLRRTPSPPAYYEELPPAYQAPTPKPKLLKRIKNMFKRTKKTQVRPLTPPPVYSSPPLPQQEPRTYAQNNLPTYQPGGNKSRRKRKSKKRISHKRS